MKNYIYKLSILMLAVAFVSSCDTVHTFYPDNTADPTPINLTINTTAKDVSAIETSDFPLSVGSDQSMRLTLEIYKHDNLEKPIHTEVMILSDTDVFDKSYGLTLELSASSYVVLGWLAYVDSSDTDNEKHYSTANGLKQITAVNPIIGNTDNKDCFFGRVDIDLTEYADQWDVEKVITLNAKRPVGKYYLISNDVEEFLSKSKNLSKGDIDNYTAEISYSGYIPTGFNTYTGELNEASSSLTYTSPLNVISDTEATIAMDYILADEAEGTSLGTAVTATVKIYDADGALVNEQSGVKFNVARNALTVVKSDFMSRSISSGLNLETGYEGTFEVIL